MLELTFSLLYDNIVISSYYYGLKLRDLNMTYFIDVFCLLFCFRTRQWNIYYGKNAAFIQPTGHHLLYVINFPIKIHGV